MQGRDIPGPPQLRVDPLYPGDPLLPPGGHHHHQHQHQGHHGPHLSHYHRHTSIVICKQPVEHQNIFTRCDRVLYTGKCFVDTIARLVYYDYSYVPSTLCCTLCQCLGEAECVGVLVVWCRKWRGHQNTDYTREIRGFREISTPAKKHGHIHCSLLASRVHS